VPCFHRFGRRRAYPKNKVVGRAVNLAGKGKRASDGTGEVIDIEKGFTRNELLSNLVFERPSCGGLICVCWLDAVDEVDAFDDVGEMCEAA